MPLPSNFNPVEQFQDTIRRVFNPRIRIYFKDVELDDDLNSDRGQLKRACFHDDKDSLGLTVAKLILYSLLILEQISTLIVGSLGGSGEQNGLKDQYHITANNLPQIKIYFAQDGSSVPTSEFAVPAEVSFRLVDFVKFKKLGDNSQKKVPTEPDLLKYANRIKVQFGNYIFNKGDELYIYTDIQNGFFGSQCYTISEASAGDFFRRLTNVAEVEYNSDLLKKSTQPGKRSNSRPTEKVQAYDNKSKRAPRWRPRVKVRFRYAVCDVGLTQPVVLVDATGLLADPLVKV